VAYLYVREDLRAKLRPALTGWLAHRRPFEFEIGALDRREDSFGFLNGTPHIPALYACQPGLDIINKVGVRAIREKSLRMTARILAGAKSRGWHVNTPGDAAEHAGTVSVECPHAAEVCQELVRRNILVDHRPKAGVRLSPHFYNTESECNFTLRQMDEIVATLDEQTSGAKVSKDSR
jgi:kynureninase